MSTKTAGSPQAAASLVSTTHSGIRRKLISERRLHSRGQLLGLVATQMVRSQALLASAAVEDHLSPGVPGQPGHPTPPPPFQKSKAPSAGLGVKRGG